MKIKLNIHKNYNYCCRFPLKNNALLKCWENYVQKVNKKPWQANQYSRLCSKHFQSTDYILPPSSNNTCRLKKYAFPSGPPVHSDSPTLTAHDEELNRRINKRPCPANESATLPPEKRPRCASSDDRDELHTKLQQKIRTLQQKLRRTKKKMNTMHEVIQFLEEKLVLNPKESEALQSTLNNTQLKFLYNFKDNIKSTPSARRYSDEIKEFALTLYFYSPRAYKYVRSLIPLPNPSLIRKWCSSFKCDPGFIDEAFTSLSQKVAQSNNNKDCCLVIDAMSIRKQTIWNPQKDSYSGFVDFGNEIPNEHPEKLATEALVFLLVGTRSHWKCPVGYFLTDKMNAKDQATLVKKCLEKAANASLKVWSVTADGTAVNINTFEILGCQFSGNYESIKSSFENPATKEDVFVILDPCHMLKLARNALADKGSFIDGDGNIIRWKHIEELQNIQEQEGLNLANKLSSNHIQFQSHKMKVNLAAQTLSSSVADAIEFLDLTQNLSSNSKGTTKFIRTIDQLFDMLNSRNPIGKGSKKPLKPCDKEKWQKAFSSIAEYLLKLKTNAPHPQLLSQTRRKTFIIGFIACIKSTISMASQMFEPTTKPKPFDYLLTYKYSQDHLELLFSCIRSRGGWNNNPNCLQMKYALRKMLMRNAITASKNANCVDFTGCSTIIPIFHTRKHQTKPSREQTKNKEDSSNSSEENDINLMCEHLAFQEHSEFIQNVLFYISGYIVAKLMDKLSCSECKKCLVPLPTQLPINGHDYTASLYHDCGRASSFTTFVNKGGLQIPSTSVFRTVQYCEHIFRSTITGENSQHISHESNLKKIIIIQVCQHFSLDSTKELFPDHEEGLNEILFEDDHRTKLTKCVADKYLTLRLFTYGKKYTKEIANQGDQSIRHKFNKLILFKNQ